MVLRYVVVCLLLLASCTAQLQDRPDKLTNDLGQYPHWFFDEEQQFNALMIVDKDASTTDRETARMMLANLREYDASIPDDLVEYPTNLMANNAIVLGSCSQVPPNKFANLYLDCVSMLEEQALIRIVPHHGVWLLFIVGYDEERTRDAVDMLSRYQEFPLRAQGLEVVREAGTYRVELPR
ncbi:MAG: hypothetical protein OXR66_01095 [Candidatus Woesearchaeota archaeon]|nr:hypothetical protein [Candidatus Woesearchaeota archaeon]